MCTKHAKSLHNAGIQVGMRESYLGGREIGVGKYRKHSSHTSNLFADSSSLPTASSKSLSSCLYIAELILPDTELLASPLNNNSTTLS